MGVSPPRGIAGAPRAMIGGSVRRLIAIPADRDRLANRPRFPLRFLNVPAPESTNNRVGAACDCDGEVEGGEVRATGAAISPEAAERVLRDRDALVQSRTGRRRIPCKVVCQACGEKPYAPRQGHPLLQYQSRRECLQYGHPQPVWAR